MATTMPTCVFKTHRRSSCSSLQDTVETNNTSALSVRYRLQNTFNLKNRDRTHSRYSIAVGIPEHYIFTPSPFPTVHLNATANPKFIL